MADWWNRTSTAAAAAVGLVGSAAYYWASSDPEGFKIDPSSLEIQSLEVPVSSYHSRHVDSACFYF